MSNPEGKDRAFAEYLSGMLRQDMERLTPHANGAATWGWTSVVLWMAEEVATKALTLDTPESTRRDMKALAEQARARVREARRSLREHERVAA